MYTCSKLQMYKTEVPTDWNTLFDDHPLIWNDFADNGYVTFFGEDRPEMATFNYRGWLHGFLRQPVDHYTR